MNYVKLNSNFNKLFWTHITILIKIKYLNDDNIYIFKNNLNNNTNLKLKITCLVWDYLNVETDLCN